MEEWEKKISAITENVWNKDVVSLSGIPSWMLVLIKAILKKTDKKNLSDVWHNLEVFFHGGVSFEPYRNQYANLISSSSMKYMETYNASEGFFGIQDDPADKSMLLMLDYGIFYEFIPMDCFSQTNENKAIPIEDVTTGVNYAMVISTCGGFWRYLIGDTVMFTLIKPYKFVITGRTNLYINAFGEEVMITNTDRAIKIASDMTNSCIKSYTVAPLFLQGSASGTHQWLIEFDKKPDSIKDFTTILDKSLQQQNSDYEAKRYKNITLVMPEIVIARDNLFTDWLKRHGKLGGQHKVPALSNNREFISELLDMNDDPK